MPEASIVITAQDRYSSVVSKMADVTKRFSKDADGLQQRLDHLNKNKTILQVDAKKAREELSALEKQFRATGDEADGLKVELARANYNNITQNLNAVSKGARETQKEIERTAGAIRKLDTASGGVSGMKGIINAVAAAGISQMAGQAAQQIGNTMIASAFGSSAGSVVSSALSGGISGAIMGTSLMSSFGPAAAGVGALAGAGIGTLTGAAGVFSKKDDAFKSYVQAAVEGQISQRESDIASGSSIAAGRETDLVSFSAMFKSEDTAKKYLGDLVEMANTTPFLYNDLTAMSKTLATYGYTADSILPVLRTVGDTGAALGMSTGDMTMVSTALGRMKSSDKTTLEYLNILNDRGVGAVGMLSDAYGVDQGTMYDMFLFSLADQPKYGVKYWDHQNGGAMLRGKWEYEKYDYPGICIDRDGRLTGDSPPAARVTRCGTTPPAPILVTSAASGALSPHIPATA